MGDAVTGFTFVFFPHDRLPLLGCSFPEACRCFGTVRSIDLAPLQTLTGNLHLDKSLVWFKREIGLPTLSDSCGRR